MLAIISIHVATHAQPSTIMRAAYWLPLFPAWLVPSSPWGRLAGLGFWGCGRLRKCPSISPDLAPFKLPRLWYEWKAELLGFRKVPVFCYRRLPGPRYGLHGIIVPYSALLTNDSSSPSLALSLITRLKQGIIPT